MKKLLLLSLCAIFLSGCTSKTSLSFEDKSIRNDIFTPAFQFVWNDFAQEFVGQKIKFLGGNPQLVDILNSNTFTTKDVSKDAYYSKVAPNTFDTKAQIEKEIYEKFREKSRILDQFVWVKPPTQDFILYTMFKKDVNFLKEFDVLEKQQFNSLDEPVKFFGIKGDKEAFTRVIKPIFYENDDEFAVALLTKEGDIITLYATKSGDNVFDLFDLISQKSKDYLKFNNNDDIKVPFINLDTVLKYDELCDREIIGSDYIIGAAIDSVKFKLDNKGAKLVNEAGILAEANSLVFEQKGRNYYFNRPFVLFMSEAGKEKPYFALRIKNLDFLVK